MRILCIGGGPAGVYFALLMKLQNPQHMIRVVERNRPFDTFGWGVVLQLHQQRKIQTRRTTTDAKDAHAAVASNSIDE